MEKQTGINSNGKEARNEANSTTSGKANNGKIPDVIMKVVKRAPRRSPWKRVGNASQLDTADDDKYDDAWLPEYGEGPAAEKMVEDEWIEVQKPKPTR